MYFGISNLVIVAFGFLIVRLSGCLSFPLLSSLLDSSLFFILSDIYPAVVAFPYCLGLIIIFFQSVAGFILLVILG